MGEAPVREPKLGRQGERALAEPGNANRLPDGTAHTAEAEAGELYGARASATHASMECYSVAQEQRSATVSVGERRAGCRAQTTGEGRDGAPRCRTRVVPVVGAVDVDAEAAPAEAPCVC
jgi:hypothetical protein